ELAKYIRTLHELTTIAYVHNKVNRHTVLPVLACRELVTAGGDATRLGEVLPDPGAVRDPVEQQGYAQIAGDARAAILLKMFDPTIEVMEGRRNGARFFFDRARRDQFPDVVGVKPDPVLPAGRLALLSGDEAVRLGFAKLNNKDSRQQVAE